MLLSPNFALVSDMGRTVVESDTVEDYANPLATADMGVYLVLLSICLLLTKSTSKSVLFRWGRLAALYLSLCIGLWVAFTSSRGEAMACVVISSCFVALVKGRSVRHALVVLSCFVIGFVLIFIFVYSGISEMIFEWSPRFRSDSINSASDIRVELILNSFILPFQSPAHFFFGVGARGVEQILGEYPHSALLQAFAETGIVGLLLFCCCYGTVIRFGFRTFVLARQSADAQKLLFAALSLSFLLYDILMANKKGSLQYHDTFMWLMLSVFSFDRVQRSLGVRNWSFDKYGGGMMERAADPASRRRFI